MSSLKPAATIWDDVLSELRVRVQQTQYDTWFAKVSCSYIDATKIVIDVPTAFYKEWLQLRYHNLLLEVFSSKLGQDGLTIEYQISTSQSVVSLPVIAKRPQSPQPAAGVPVEVELVRVAPAAPLRRPAGRTESTQHLNHEYRFEKFVIGPSNRLAHAAAMAVVEDLGRVYNPLFIHGGLGLGKTHLLQAICHELLDARPDLRLLYIPCEQFVNRFIAALEKGKGQIEAFRNHYRMLDVLLIDDIHFLANKDHTQEEFFHTFNALYNDKKQIILSSDSAPKDIPTIEDRLVSRFQWGLVCEIEAPTFEMRMAIIRKKAAMHGAMIPDDVAEFMASSLKKSVRELEGAVTSLIGYVRIMDQPMTQETAKVALADMLGTRRRRITMDRIISLVTEHFEVRLSDLQSKKRVQTVTVPRQVCMYLARRYTNHSLSEIGGYFGGRDHSTVLYASEKITSRLEEDEVLSSSLRELCRQLET